MRRLMLDLRLVRARRSLLGKWPKFKTDMSRLTPFRRCGLWGPRL